MEAHLKFKSKKGRVWGGGLSSNPSEFSPRSFDHSRSFTAPRIALPTYLILQFDFKPVYTHADKAGKGRSHYTAFPGWEPSDLHTSLKSHG